MHIDRQSSTSMCLCYLGLKYILQKIYQDFKDSISFDLHSIRSDYDTSSAVNSSSI